jgi:hypothetical protein
MYIFGTLTLIEMRINMIVSFVYSKTMLCNTDCVGGLRGLIKHV